MSDLGRIELIEAGSREAERLCAEVLAPRANLPFGETSFRDIDWTDETGGQEWIGMFDGSRVVSEFRATKAALHPLTEEPIIRYDLELSFSRELREHEFWPGPPLVGEEAFEVLEDGSPEEIAEAVANAQRNSHHVAETWKFSIDDATHTPRKTIDRMYFNGLNEVVEVADSAEPDLVELDEIEVMELEFCAAGLLTTFDQRDIALIEAICRVDGPTILEIITDEGGWGGSEDGDGGA